MAERPLRPGRLLLWALAAAILAGMGVYFYFADPFSTAPSLLPRCVFYEATGWYCPGCGSGRAAHSLLHGRFALAWACNPLVILALPLLLAGLANELARSARGRPLWRWRAPAALLLAVAAALVLFAVLRNLPSPRFDALRPPALAPPDADRSEAGR